MSSSKKNIKGEMGKNSGRRGPPGVFSYHDFLFLRKTCVP